MAQNQNKALNPIRMDSRKFLGALNDSAQAKISFFESKIKELGRAAGKNWRLAALYSKDLYIEDVDSYNFYIAKHSRNQGSVTISDIRHITIVESQKAGLFEDSCLRLVESIEKNDQRGMQHSFGRMKAQRFTSRIIPESGFIKGKDDVFRKINVKTPKQINEDLKRRIVKAVVESISNRIILEGDRVVGGNFVDGERLNLPVSKWATKKLNAKFMRNAAMDAYLSEGFQDRTYDIANMISEGNIEKAVQIAAPFLNEYEEFTLLNRSQVKELVSNALAAKAIFNPQLCEDTATLFFKTNLKVNKKKIVTEWKQIASVTENFNLAQNISVLEESKDFENTYNKFLDLIFETIGNREIAAEALALTLDKLKEKTPQIKESQDLAAKLDDLITRLKDKSVDDSTIYEAEDLIATIQEELTASENLGDFDKMPGEPEGAEAPLDEEIPGADKAAGAGGPPTIVFNAPLIQYGGQTSTGADGGADDMGLGDEEMAPEGEDDLAALLNEPPTTPPAPGGAPAAPAPGGAPAPRLEGRTRRGRVALESQKAKPKSYPVANESNDVYRYVSKVQNSGLMGQYGKSIIESKEQISTIVKMVGRYKIANRLTESQFAKNIYKIAEACIRKLVLNLNESALPLAINQIVDEIGRQKAVAESQYKFGRKRVGKRSTIGSDPRKGYGSGGGSAPKSEEESEGSEDNEGKGIGKWKKPWEKKEKATSESNIRWTGKNGDVMYGVYRGTKFALDHGNKQLPPVIMSEDGTIEIPIPNKVQASALAAAKVSSGNPRLFREWLAGSIDQLAPITESEKDEISSEKDDEISSMKPVESTEPTEMSGGPEDEESVPDFSDTEGDISLGDDGMEDEMGDGMDDEMDDKMGDGMDDEMGDGMDDEMDDVDGVDMGDIGADEGDLDLDMSDDTDELDGAGDSDHELRHEIDEIHDEIDEIKDELGLEDEDEYEDDIEMDAEAGDIEDMEMGEEGIDDMDEEGIDGMDEEGIDGMEGMEGEEGMDDMGEEGMDDEYEDIDDSDESDDEMSDGGVSTEDDGDDDNVEIEDEDDMGGLAEDNDFTDPSKSKYKKQVEEDPRTDIKKSKLNKRKDDESIEGIGDREDIDELDI